MADAPAGSGGGISGAEIILLVVLGLGALAVLSGNPIKPFSAPSPAAPITTPTAPVAVVPQVCDISPLVLQSLKKSIKWLLLPVQ